MTLLKKITTISILLTVAFTQLQAQAKDLSMLKDFSYGVSAENETVPANINLVSGPWVVGDWGSHNTSWLTRMNSPQNINKVSYQNFYIMAGKARQDWGLQDCNIGVAFTQTLCYNGANYIRYNKEFINQSYINAATQIRNVIGINKEIAIHIEPDFYQYTSNTQNGGGLTYTEAHSALNQWTTSIKRILPNSTLILDVSPWNKDLANWSAGFVNFDYAGMVGKRFSPTGDGTVANGVDGKSYKEIATQTGKKLILNDSHGVGGYYLPFNQEWVNPTLVSDRIKDGVIAVIMPPNDFNSLSKLRPVPITSSAPVTTLPLQTPRITPILTNPTPINPSICTKNNLELKLVKTDIWQNGFNSVIRAKNTGSRDIYYWSVIVNPSSDQRIIGHWNLTRYGNQFDPNATWNATIRPGQEIEVGGFSTSYDRNTNLPGISCNF